MRVRVSLAALIMCATLGDAPPAVAQGLFSFWSDPPPRPRQIDRFRAQRKETRAAPVRRAPAAEAPAAREAQAEQANDASALVAVISIRSQSLVVYNADGTVLRSRVSTGKAGHDTPTGIFSVIQRNRYHESNIYSGAPMPWMQRITWSGIALHGGVVPGYPASHGCIRLPYSVAPKMWSLGRMGMRVVVTPVDTGVRAIASPVLPKPRLLDAGEVAQLLPPVNGQSVLPAGTAIDRRFNPVEVAGLMKKHAALEVAHSKVVVREAMATSAHASAEANAAIAERKLAQVALAAAEAASRSLAQTADAEIKDQVEMAAAKIAADERLKEARQRYAAAVERERVEDPQAYELARAARDAEARAEEAPIELREASRRASPVSVFISRSEGRVFIRQGFEAVMDAPVEIADWLEPLGTHVYTAMAPASDSKDMRWSVLSMPGSGAETTAEAAIARITMPAHVRDEIARRLWTGGSIVISDRGVSNETGRGTDFIIETR